MKDQTEAAIRSVSSIDDEITKEMLDQAIDIQRGNMSPRGPGRRGRWLDGWRRTGAFRRKILIMAQSWGQNPGLVEQKLAKKARFTCVVSAFDPLV